MSETSRAAAAPEAGSAGHTHRARRAAATIFGAILVVALVPLVVGALGALAAGDVGSLLFYLLFLVLPANLGFMGIVLTIRRPRNPIGWLLLVSGVLAAVAFAGGEYGRDAVASGTAGSTVVQIATWLGSWAFIPAIGLLVVFLPLLYPNGELLGRRWRWFAALAVAGVALGAIGPAVAPGPMGEGGPDNPFAAPEPLRSWIEAASAASNLLAPPVFLLALASLLIRFRRSSGIERQQIKWLLFVATIAAIAFATSIVSSGPVSDGAWIVGLLTVAGLPLAIGLAILRYGLYEIDRIVNRAIVYGVVSAILAGVFAAATTLSQRLFVAVAGQSSDAAVVLTTLLVVAVYAPVRKRVEALVDRYFKYDQRAYGRYLDELRHLLELIEPRRAAVRLAREALAHTNATGVAVLAPDGSVTGSAGAWPAEPAVSVPIGVSGSPFAALLVGPRRDGKPHPDARLRELADAAVVAATAVIAG